MTSPLDRLIDAAVRCRKCKGSIPSRFEAVNKLTELEGTKVCRCVVCCSCGWLAKPGAICRNPNTARCFLKVKYGTYNRKARRYE